MTDKCNGDHFNTIWCPECEGTLKAELIKSSYETGKLEGLRIQHEGHDNIWNDALEEAARIIENFGPYGEIDKGDAAGAIRALKRITK